MSCLSLLLQALIYSVPICGVAWATVRIVSLLTAPPKYVFLQILALLVWLIGLALMIIPSFFGVLFWDWPDVCGFGIDQASALYIQFCWLPFLAFFLRRESRARAAKAASAAPDLEEETP